MARPPLDPQFDGSRYALMQSRWREDSDEFRRDLRGDGSFDYLTQVKELERLQMHINEAMLVYLFGEMLGKHLAQKFLDNNRNLLRFLSQLTSEYRMCILYELKTNPHLFHQG